MGPVTSPGAGPAPITSRHDLSSFDSGDIALDDWLRRRALKNERQRHSRTYVLTSDGSRVIGYYALSAGSMLLAAAPRPLTRNAPDPLPTVLLGRLAVDRSQQAIGLGGAMLRDALLRTLAAADIIGIRLVVVHAISNAARDFYVRNDFVPTPGEPLTLIYPFAPIQA